MSGSDEKYSRQPAYNEFLMPTCLPSYSEAVSMSNPGPAPAPPPAPAQTLLIMNQPPVQTLASGAMAAPVAVGPTSSFITCPNCYKRGKTNTRSTNQKSAHILCFLLCLFGCCLCSCIPYCMNSFKIINHYCSNCNTFVGFYKY